MIHVEDYNLEPPEDIVSCYCHICGRDILVDEDYYFLDFDEMIICDDCIRYCKRVADETI